MTQVKVCSKCKAEKSSTTEFFCADKRNRDGLQASCKECDRKRHRVAGKIVSPKRAAFADDAAFQTAMEWYRLQLDRAAAERILADPESKLSKRSIARESLDKTLAAMKKARPNDIKADGSVVAPAVVEPSKRVWISPELEPGSEAYRNAASKLLHLNGADSLESLQRWYGVQEQWEREHPESFKAECQRREDEENERRRRNLEEHNGSAPHVRTVADKAAIAIAAETVPAFVPPPQHDKVFVLRDGYHFYPDCTEAIPPLPLGVTFHRASNPPGYEPGSRKIRSGLTYDWQHDCWFQE